MTLKGTLRILLVAAAVFATSVHAMAQMTDDAVVSYVKDAMASGKSQQAIVKELAARGVTREQAERIKQQYEAGQTSGTEAVTKAGVQERERRIGTDMENVQAGELDLIAAEVANPAEMTEGTAARLIFGRNIFTNRNLTFAPSGNIATPENYRLGPGDEVIIDIWGTNQNTIRSTISPDGYINITDVGLVYLNGMTVKEADNYLRRQLGKIYSVSGDNARSEIKLTLGNVRTIQVNVMGEVAVPGTYFLSSLSNIYHALYRAGGVSSLGSLRDIKLIRSGKEVASVDIYDFILNGKSPDDVMLQEGDIITVPTYDMLVDITGNVKRPMFYEMKDGETVSDLIGYAGGFTGDAYRSTLRMIRQNGREYKVYTIDEPEYASFKLMDGDALSVGMMLDRFENKIEIKGAVYRPGIYELGDGISTVLQLINKAEGIKGDAFVNRAILHREKPDLTLEVISLDIKGLLDGSVADLPLQKNDVLYISSIHDLEDIGHITVSGEVARPGDFIYADNTTLEDIIMQAGGLLESASVVKVDVSRRIRNPKSMTATDSLSQTFTFALKDGFVIDGEPGFVLKAYDRVYVRRSPGYSPQRHVSIQGEVLFAGNYPITHKNQRVSELVNQAGGVTDWAYVKGAKLMRRISLEERERMQSTLAMLGRGRDSVNVSNLELGDVYYVGLDLQEAIDNPGSDMDLVLRDGDVLFIPEYVNTVKISGNVMYPNTVVYNPKMTVKDFVKMAGGYGFRAKRSKAYVIYMNGTVDKAAKFSRKVVEPGCEIVVPEKRKGDGTGLQSILSIATTSASLATMIATIGNLLK